MPVINPVAEPTVATIVLLLLHAPPVAVTDRVVVVASQIPVVPEIVPRSFTLNTPKRIQPVGSV